MVTKLQKAQIHLFLVRSLKLLGTTLIRCFRNKRYCSDDQIIVTFSSIRVQGENKQIRQVDLIFLLKFRTRK